MSRIKSGKTVRPAYATKPPKPEKRDIWTFEAAADVAAMMSLVLKEAPRGERTRIINDALREKHPEAAAQIAEAEAEAAIKRAREMRSKVGGKH